MRGDGSAGSPDAELRARISSLVGGPASSFVGVRGGYTDAARWTFRAKGQRHFAKVGTTPWTCEQLNREIAVYDTLNGAFMPARVAGETDATAPILILEDLSGYHWPPPWRPGQIERVLDQIAQIHASTADLPPFEAVHGKEAPGWSQVAGDTAPFLSLRLVSARWLDDALPNLLEAESRCVTEGTAPTHWDLRSDNICLTDRAVKLIDWNYACQSNPKLDLGFWLPSLAHEGGPAPESFLPDEPEIAAFVSGFFAARAGLPNIENAPRVRTVQRQQLAPALSWAIRVLGLPPQRGMP